MQNTNKLWLVISEMVVMLGPSVIILINSMLAKVGGSRSVIKRNKRLRFSEKFFEPTLLGKRQCNWQCKKWKVMGNIM